MFILEVCSDNSGRKYKQSTIVIDIDLPASGSKLIFFLISPPIIIVKHNCSNTPILIMQMRH